MPLDLTQFPPTLALLGLVLVVAALLSGAIERSGTPQVAVFLALGAAVGPYGLNLLQVGIDSPALQLVASLSLSLILFTDAVTLNFAEVRRHAKLAMIVLIPGTMGAAAIIAATAHFGVGITLAMAAILGAALASTDPVMLRGLLRWRGLPDDTRLALRLESGLNDIVLLPVVLMAIAAIGVLGPDGETHSTGLLQTVLRVALGGPIVGFAIGAACIGILILVRRRIGVRRDYESLYSIGIAFLAYGVGEALHTSGFVAAFAAGVAIATLDRELCDCFVEYGETTAELAMLFTFVLLGVQLFWDAQRVWLYPGVALVALVALAARPLTLRLALARSHLTSKSRKLLLWFGPRGLSSILLALLAVFARVPNAAFLFQICCATMLLSIVVHGGSVMALLRRPSVAKDPEIVIDDTEPIAISATTLRDIAGGPDAMLIDVRRKPIYDASPVRLANDRRIEPTDDAGDQAFARDIKRDQLLGVYCTCPNEKTSIRIATELRSAGYARAYAIVGGMEALSAAGYGTAPKPIDE